MKKLLLIESSDIGALYSAEATRALGYEPVFLCELKDYQGDTLEQLLRYRHLDTPTHSAETLLAFLQNHPNWGQENLKELAGVMSFADSRLMVAHEVAHALGVPGLDPAVGILKSKSAVAKLAPEYSPPTLSFYPSRPPLAALSDLLATCGKLIIKPSQGAGARGVLFIKDETELADLPDRLRNRPVPAEMESDGWVAQAFVEGPLFSVEGFVLQGKIRMLGLTGRRRILSTESAADFPIDATVSASTHERLAEATAALVGRSRFRNGYFHLEFIAASDQLRLVDANAGRLGGGPVGELLALSYGVDPIDIYRHVIEVSLLGRASRDPYAEHHHMGEPRRESYSILYGLEKGGILEDVEMPANLRCYHTRILDRGAKVSPMGIDDWSWVGILTGLKADALEAIARIRIHTRDGVFPPCY